jgi:cytochrome c5
MKDQGYEHAHSSPIRTPQQLAVVVVLSFVIPVIGLILLASFIISGHRTTSIAEDPDALARRIQPVARVEFAEAQAGPRAAKSGEEVYKTVCSACHGTGAAGAVKFGDKAAWAPRIKTGLDALVKNALTGIRAMPPRGGNPDLSDLEVTRAIVYMTNAAGAEFKEPAAPAAAAAKPAATAAERTGEQIVTAGCGNCHLTGEGGAPRVGDRAAWSKRISAGIDKVTASAIRGHGGMPARGGFADLTDPEVKKAILYMFDAAGGKLVPAAAAPAVAAPAAAAPAAAAEDKGKAIYSQTCVACHGQGVAGAPKFGDKATWAPRIKTGMDALYTTALKGKGAMPPKGGNASLADADVKAAVDYMVAAAK